VLLVILYGSFIHLIRKESEVNHIIILEIQGNLASYPLEIQGCCDKIQMEKKGGMEI
jgi:tRNA nucleotidyltransferase (CCA-adding enzyme)